MGNMKIQMPHLSGCPSIQYFLQFTCHKAEFKVPYMTQTSSKRVTFPHLMGGECMEHVIDSCIMFVVKL